MANCEKYHDLISAYIDDIATEDETAELFVHVASCDDCCALLDSYTIVDSLFIEDEKAPEDLAPSIMAEIHKIKTMSGAGKRAKRIVFSTLAAAACLALAVFSAGRLGILPFSGAKSSSSAENSLMSFDVSDAIDSDSSTYGTASDESEAQASGSAAADDMDASIKSPDDSYIENSVPAEIEDPISDENRSEKEGDSSAEGTETTDTSSPPDAPSEGKEPPVSEIPDNPPDEGLNGDWSSVGADYFAVVYMSGDLPDIVSQRGFYTFGIESGVLGIEIDPETLSVLDALGEYSIFYHDVESDWALIVYLQGS